MVSNMKYEVEVIDEYQRGSYVYKFVEIKVPNLKAIKYSDLMVSVMDQFNSSMMIEIVENLRLVLPPRETMYSILKCKEPTN